MGLQHAFGIMGGAVVPFHGALERSPVGVFNCRHESGAVFAALEASVTSDAPALAYTTTGPGLTNALTGAITARWEGAKLLLVSGYTPAVHRGRFAMQESNGHALASELYLSRGMFDYALALEDPAELPQVMRALVRGFANPRGFVAHIAMPLAVQSSPAPTKLAMTLPAVEVSANSATLSEVVHRLADPFAIWVGWGARHASKRVRELVERTGAPVLTTPRGKGIFPEDHPRHLGVSGIFGGHEDLAERLAAEGVERLLVLGSRLGEVSSGYDERLIPPGGLIHVDLDPAVPGAAFPEAETLVVQAEIDGFLKNLLERIEGDPSASRSMMRVQALDILRTREAHPRPSPPKLVPRDPDSSEAVRPQYLLQCIQERVVEGSQSVILAESGNSFAWTANLLRFREPMRYRQSGLFCPMGHVCAGAIGAAAATGRRAVALVGDGAFLMQNEISTAARTGANVTWIVLNDARFGMIDQGLHALGKPPSDVHFPEVDFLAVATAMGADGARVTRESQVQNALEWAMNGRGPFVLDVVIDTHERAPFGRRVLAVNDQSQGAP